MVVQNNAAPAAEPAEKKHFLPEKEKIKRLLLVAVLAFLILFIACRRESSSDGRLKNFLPTIVPSEHMAVQTQALLMPRSTARII